MNVVEIISKKANKQELTNEEIQFIVQGVNDYLKDYQLAAFLMAVKINGFSNNELFAYTDAILSSGKTLPFKENRVDKHSTGGIGDKVSLILFPIFEKLGIQIFKFSGRGLGYTGGTLDKIDTIQNFRVNYSYDEILNSKSNLLLEPSLDFAPVEKTIYAIRDVTATVDSPYLISASIMAKKISSGAKYIFIDLKCGSGGFAQDKKQAIELAKLLKIIAVHYQRELFVLITNMNEPLGWSAGNAIEVQEALNFFDGKREAKLEILIEKIATEIYAKINAVSKKVAKEKYEQLFLDKSLKESFFDWIESQGGKVNALRDKAFFVEKNRLDFHALQDGYMKYQDIKKIGFFLIAIKAGRMKKDDKIYPYSGIQYFFKNGDEVKKGDLLFSIYSEFPLSIELKQKVDGFYLLENQKVKSEPIIIDEITW